MFVTVNDELYPKDLRTTTFNCELYDILGEHSAFINPVIDVELYNMSDLDLFSYLTNITYPSNIDINNDYKYYIPFHEIGDSGYRFFCISDGVNIKIIVGKDDDKRESFIFIVILRII